MSMIINHVEFFLWYFFSLVFLDSCGVCSTDMCFWYCKWGWTMGSCQKPQKYNQSFMLHLYFQSIFPRQNESCCPNRWLCCQVYQQKNMSNIFSNLIFYVESKMDPLSFTVRWIHPCLMSRFMLTLWVDLHIPVFRCLKDLLLMSPIWEAWFVKDLLDHLVLSLWVCAELLFMKYFHLKLFHLWWFITVYFLMFMPHIASQKINFSG